MGDPEADVENEVLKNEQLVQVITISTMLQFLGNRVPYVINNQSDYLGRQRISRRRYHLANIGH